MRLILGAAEVGHPAAPERSRQAQVEEVVVMLQFAREAAEPLRLVDLSGEVSFDRV
jgi:hypothetical protein